MSGGPHDLICPSSTVAEMRHVAVSICITLNRCDRAAQVLGWGGNGRCSAWVEMAGASLGWKWQVLGWGGNGRCSTVTKPWSVGTVQVLRGTSA